ncbi:hypothetical protein FOWG_12587 [Fusarium oxysporum f. sp. lycopersici MN25]|nr:hypothetical protein FOWG_12587 [Fusarium oxysporum f. sp. lycopersici MN25]
MTSEAYETSRRWEIVESYLRHMIFCLLKEVAGLR